MPPTHNHNQDDPRAGSPPTAHQHQPGAAGDAPAADDNLPPPSPLDKIHLDEFFDLAIAAIEDGHEPDIAAAALGREHLRPHLEQHARLARIVCGRPGHEVQPTFGGYRIIRELGRGGMGVVYLARQENLNRDVALKVLLPHFAMSPTSRERFTREARAIAMLRHPSIVSVFDLVVDRNGTDEAHGFTMEWVEGRSLQELVADLAKTTPKGESPTPSALAAALRGTADGAGPARDYASFVARIGAALARALQAVHDAGLHHRDIKPSNVLLRRDGAPMLSDFGLVANSGDDETGRWREPPSTTRNSNPAREQRVARDFAGTAAYSAPEQLRGQTVGKRTDIYGLGVTLFHALALRPPFAGADAAAVLAQITTGLPPTLREFVPSISRDLERVVLKAMQRDPARRYESAASFAGDLERAAAGLPLEGDDAGAWGSVRAWLGRHMVALIVGALIAAAGFVAGWLLRG